MHEYSKSYTIDKQSSVINSHQILFSSYSKEYDNVLAVIDENALLKCESKSSKAFKKKDKNIYFHTNPIIPSQNFSWNEKHANELEESYNDESSFVNRNTDSNHINHIKCNCRSCENLSSRVNSINIFGDKLDNTNSLNKYINCVDGNYFTRAHALNHVEENQKLCEEELKKLSEFSLHKKYSIFELYSELFEEQLTLMKHLRLAWTSERLSLLLACFCSDAKEIFEEGELCMWPNTEHQRCKYVKNVNTPTHHRGKIEDYSNISGRCDNYESVRRRLERFVEEPIQLDESTNTLLMKRKRKCSLAALHVATLLTNNC